ncbi:MAG TPA: CHAD domain-containing protein [Solirubrobacteraceae bacterium]|nr:CHAD domain-containing protein [Solirubrobacteraceae bacterium]
MSYRFEPNEGVRAGILRTARDQLDAALHALHDEISDDPVEAVHTARKAVKKERSLLRLARAALPAKQRRVENAALRRAARGLSDARDAEVMVQTLDQLSQRFAGQLPESSFATVRVPLEGDRDAHRAQLADSARVPEAAGQLAGVRARIDAWPLRVGGWPALEPGLARSYRRGRKAIRAAERRRSAERMHAWRKRVKDLWYQERLLAPVGGPAIRGQAKDLHRLADLLGDHHDLGVLRRRLTDEPLPVGADVDGIVGLIEHRQAELEGEALALGSRIYAEKPGAFVRRMRRAWRAGRALEDGAGQPQPVELAQATRANPAG